MNQTETRITPGQTWSIGEVWRYRHLVYYFTWRDVKVKYKQTFLGILWAVIQPAFLTTLFYLVFGRSLPNDAGIHYAVYAFGGLTLWGLFSGAVTGACDNMTTSQQVIKKVYFPRIVLPLASLATAVIDFIIAFAAFILLSVLLGQEVSTSALFYFPSAVIFLLASAFAIGILLSALSAKYRDFRYAMPFVMQIFFFTSQIVFTIRNLEWPWLQRLLYINPLNGALELFYQPLRPEPVNPQGMIISTGALLFFAIAGTLYFRNTEKHLADIV